MDIDTTISVVTLDANGLHTTNKIIKLSACKKQKTKPYMLLIKGILNIRKHDLNVKGWKLMQFNSTSRNFGFYINFIQS